MSILTDFAISTFGHLRRLDWWTIFAGALPFILWWLFRHPIIGFISVLARKCAQPHPRLGIFARKIVDRAYPSWRTTAGQTRGDFRLEWRLETGRRLRHRNYFHILGPTYIDMTLTPIDGTYLRKTELSNLDSPEVNVGGSSVYVGRYLKSEFKTLSLLYTRFGVNDKLRINIKRIIKDESWVQKIESETDLRRHNSVSVHLVQGDNAFFTTFTHRGASSKLRWEWCSRKLQKRGKRGGFLVLTGLFRTNLTINLRESLEKIPPRMVTILDSGLYNGDEHCNADRAALQDVFSRNLIDIYICSSDELRDVMSAKDGELKLKADAPIEEALVAYMTQECRLIPRITIVRSEISPSAASAYLAVEGRVSLITGQPPEFGGTANNRKTQQPGLRNVLTATVAYNFASYDIQSMTLEDAAYVAVQDGLNRIVGTTLPVRDSRRASRKSNKR